MMPKRRALAASTLAGLLAGLAGLAGLASGRGAGCSRAQLLRLRRGGVGRRGGHRALRAGRRRGGEDGDGRKLPGRGRRAARAQRRPGRAPLVRLDRPRVSVRQRPQVRDRHRRLDRRRHPRPVSRDSRRVGVHRAALRRELQSPRSARGQQHLGGRGGHDDRGRPRRHRRPASRGAPQPGRLGLLLGQHDGFRARGARRVPTFEITRGFRSATA